MNAGNNDFIEVYDAALDGAACAALIDRFEERGGATRGRAGGSVDTAVKNSWDVTIGGKPEWQDAEGALNAAMLGGLRRYLRKYPYALLGPLRLKARDPRTGEASVLDAQALAALADNLLDALIFKTLRPGTINIQKYLADEGGYPRWHCELQPRANDPACEQLHRTLLWTIYLNEGFDGGETEFLHQRRTIVPRTGSLLIAPAAFTHTHRGNMPRRAHKYIATSWILFQRAESALDQS